MDSNSVIVITEVIKLITTLGVAVIGAVLTGIFVLVAAIIAYKGGLHMYFKKREHEQIIKRYLEEGIDRTLLAVNQALRVYIDNYTKAKTVLNRFQRGQKVKFPIEFKRFERHILELTPYNKITYLIGDNIFWLTIQLLFGLVDGHSNSLNERLQPTFTEKDKSKSEILGKIKNYNDETYQQFNKYLLIGQELQKIALNLEKQTTLNWSNLAQFKDRPEIKASIKRLKESFGSEIQKYNQ